MKDRILKGWSITRAAYLIIGLSVSVGAFTEKQYLFLIPGLYFTAMGVFALGCASGSCSIDDSPSIKNKLS